MSRYSEKRQVAADCTAASCDEQASKLLLIGGKPWWTCDYHYDELSAAEKRGQVG